MPDYGAISGVEREYVASQRALHHFARGWNTLDEAQRRDLLLSEVALARARLEATYILRTLSAFEETLRARLEADGIVLGHDAGFRVPRESIRIIAGRCRRFLSACD